MSTPIQITIVGLGLIGTSFGLAVKRQKRDDLRLIGHDKADAAVKSARSKGAIDAGHWNLIRACEEADVILLAVPAADVIATLAALRQDLKPGCLLLDAAPIKAPILAAAASLPDNVYFVGGNPILVTAGRRTAAEATATLFDNIPWALCPTPSLSPEVVSAISDLVTMVGAQPFFLDAAEHDGLMAAVDGLPTLLAGALLNAAGKHASWRELRRLAGAQFEAATYLPDQQPADFTTALLGNSAGVLHWLDQMIGQLQDWRTALSTGDEAALAKNFTRAAELRSQWLSMAARGDFEESERPQPPTSLWSRFFGQTTRSG
jgi:prephenate dehydrogenase